MCNPKTGLKTGRFERVLTGFKAKKRVKEKAKETREGIQETAEGKREGSKATETAKTILWMSWPIWSSKQRFCDQKNPERDRLRSFRVGPALALSQARKDLGCQSLVNHPPDSVLGVLRPPKTAEPDRSDERSRFQVQPKAWLKEFLDSFYMFLWSKKVAKFPHLIEIDQNWQICSGVLLKTLQTPPGGGSDPPYRGGVDLVSRINRESGKKGGGF